MRQDAGAEQNLRTLCILSYYVKQNISLRYSQMRSQNFTII